MRVLFRSLLVVLLVLGIVLPKASAALALILPTYGTTMTICTPTGLITLRMDANGSPIKEDPTETAPCLMAHADMITPASIPQWHRIARNIDRTQSLKARPVPVTAVQRLRPPGRAPPLS
ncbi:MAG: hypothetical protein ABJL67_15265 [Sulfitobacter sp.]